MVGRRKELTPCTKDAIVKLFKTGIKQSDISRRLGIPRTTVTGVIKRFKQRGGVENLPRKGAPVKLGDRDSRRLLRLVKGNRKQTLSDITSIFNQTRDSSVSRRTIQRKLFNEGYHRRVIRKRIRIREVNRKNRVNWCRVNRRRTLDHYWRRVIFSDECKVEIGTDNRVFIWRRVGEEWLPCCLGTPPTPKFSVMIWGCITYEGVGTLSVVDGNLNAQDYIRILEDNLWPVVVRHFPTENYIFQDDNAPIHRARVVTEFKNRNRIHSMIWPAQSPDLNVIENVWYRLKRQLKNHRQILDTKEKLKLAIRDIWINFPRDYIRNLYSSIPKRIQNVLKSKGHITKY